MIGVRAFACFLNEFDFILTFTANVLLFHWMSVLTCLFMFCETMFFPRLIYKGIKIEAFRGVLQSDGVKRLYVCLPGIYGKLSLLVQQLPCGDISFFQQQHSEDMSRSRSTSEGLLQMAHLSSYPAALVDFVQSLEENQWHHICLIFDIKLHAQETFV